jgi:hypothetical protein
MANSPRFGCTSGNRSIRADCAPDKGRDKPQEWLRLRHSVRRDQSAPSFSVYSLPEAIVTLVRATDFKSRK